MKANLYPWCPILPITSKIREESSGDSYLAGEIPEFLVKSEYFRMKSKKVRLGLRGFAKDKELTEAPTCI